jgi:hypothetical protein
MGEIIMIKTYDSVKLYPSGVYLIDGKDIVKGNEKEKLSSFVENTKYRRSKKGNYSLFNIKITQHF